MKLIGMLDSPYVRRVAISLQLLGIAFEHRPLSVFRTFDEFQRINPVVKAPTLVCDDGTVLMDSTLILDHAETLAAPGRTLMPRGTAERRQALRCLGLALAACEKSVQLVYEGLRPADKQHEPWITRVRGQMGAALAGLEDELGRYPLARGEAIDQAGVTAAVVWYFVRAMQPEFADPATHPRLVAWSADAERLAAFAAAPHGVGTVGMREGAT
jgi:glutathione S-transferase